MLSKAQLDLLNQHLSKLTFKHPELKEEMLDHLCSSIEQQMTSGLAFDQACKITFNNFQEDEIKAVDEQIFNYLNHKQIIMKKLSFLVLGLMFFSSILWAVQQEPPSLFPLEDARISSGFGDRFHPILKVGKMHTGIDFPAPTGTPIYATADGVVERAVNKTGGYGNNVLIKHDEEYHSFYAQMSEFKVKKGQKVKKGEIIGWVGSSGMSTAPHLHYEVWKNGKAINPEPFLKSKIEE